MASVNRRYQKFLLLLTILGSTTLFLLIQKDDDHSKALIIYDGSVKNAPFLRSGSTMIPIKVKECFEISVDQVHQLASVTREVAKDTPVITPTRNVIEKHVTSKSSNKSTTLSAQRRVDVKPTANATASNATAANATVEVKKTQYPVTLYAPYVIENPTLCSSVPDLDVMVIVHTAPKNFDRRNTIRATWTNQTYFKNIGTVRVLFLLGRTSDEKVQQDIETEFVEYGDILQGEFVDAYRNLTHKGVMGYKWLSERCRNAKMILKCDDDVVMNMYEVMTVHLPELKVKTKHIYCNHILPGTMLIIRKNNSKWYVDENQFKGKKFYPRYCSGFAVFFSNDMMPALYRAASVTPFFWVDDVYLYGLVPGKVPGIQYSGFRRGAHQLTGPRAVECYKNVTKTCNFLIAGAGKREVADTIWGFMTKQYHSSLIKIPTEPAVIAKAPANDAKQANDKPTAVEAKAPNNDAKQANDNPPAVVANEAKQTNDKPPAVEAKAPADDAKKADDKPPAVVANETKQTNNKPPPPPPPPAIVNAPTNGTNQANNKPPAPP